MKKHCLAAALIILSAASASAADLAARPYTKAPPVSPVFDWSGFYIGAHGGYADANDPATATFSPAAYTTAIVPAAIINGFGGGVPPTTPPFGLSADPKGGFGGFQLGYNWQVSSWVFGLEADASFGRMRGQDAKPFFVNASIGGDDGRYTGVARLQQTIDAFGTIRGRVGYAADRVLLYVTGGFAWADAQTRFAVDSVVFSFAPNYSPAQQAALSNSSASSSGFHYGYSAGGGIEWAFDRNWSLKAEYLYLGLRSGGTTLAIPGNSANTSHFDLHTAKGGINYRF
jgi:outer membrane immunogenic protein